MTVPGRYQFPVGLDAVAEEWTTGTFEWALADPSWAPDPSTETFMSALAAYELTDGSYSRQAVASPTRTPTAPATPTGEGVVRFDCANPSWVAIAGGESVGWAVLFQQVTNDADSPIALALPMSYVTSGLTLTLTVSAYGVWQFSTYCPAQF